MKSYDFLKNNPVARFFYKGKSHTHPVRRTVVLVEADDSKLTGYELREGASVRLLNKSTIKTFRRDKIARIGQVDARRVIRATAKNTDLSKTTLRRTNLLDLLRDGI